jgi:uncharacterized protein involved in copper resistance
VFAIWKMLIGASAGGYASKPLENQMNKSKLFLASIITALFAVTSPSFAADKGADASGRTSEGKCPMMKMMDMKDMKCMGNAKGTMDKNGMQDMMGKCTMMNAKDDMSSQQQSRTTNPGKTREQVIQELKEHEERMRTDRAYAHEWRMMYHY